MINKADVEVLNSVYRNARTGADAIGDLLPAANDRRFISDLETQCGGYEAIGNEAATRLIALGEKPTPVGTAKRVGMKVGTAMNTMVNDSAEHLAELMVKGSNMGIIDMTKTVNSCPNAAPETLGLAQKLIAFENDNISRLKTYLKIGN